MDGEPTRESELRGDFERIVRNSYRDRPQPVGPYMRWPLGLALVLIAGQVFAAGLAAVAAAVALTSGHSSEVTTAELWRTMAVGAGVAAVLAWAAYQIRSRVLTALYVALVVEACEVAARGYFLLRDEGLRLGPYVGFGWALAALVALTVPSSRAYCTRRRTAS